MIAFRDFKAEPPGFFPKAGRADANFAAALVEANRWIEDAGIDVLNVETMGYVTSLEMPAIRIWYRASSKPESTPEI